MSAPMSVYEMHLGSWMRHPDRSFYSYRDLAERLVLRDVEQDDRRVCVECMELTESGRCRAAGRGDVPGVGSPYEPATTILHRCPAFTTTVKLA